MLFFLTIRGKVCGCAPSGAPLPTIGLAGLFTPRSDVPTNEGAVLADWVVPLCVRLRLVFESPNLPSEDLERRKLEERRRMNRETKLGRREVSSEGC